jgi:hypothetical protein
MNPEFDRRMEKLYKEYTRLAEEFARTHDDSLFDRMKTKIRQYTRLLHIKKDEMEMSKFQ